MITLLDNTVLSNFSHVERPDLVELALGETAATVEEVYAELQASIRLGKLPLQVIHQPPPSGPQPSTC